MLRFRISAINLYNPNPIVMIASRPSNSDYTHQAPKAALVYIRHYNSLIYSRCTQKWNIQQTDTPCIWSANYQNSPIHRVFACFSVWTSRYIVYRAQQVPKSQNTPCICSNKSKNAKYIVYRLRQASKCKNSWCIDDFSFSARYTVYQPSETNLTKYILQTSK